MVFGGEAKAQHAPGGCRWVGRDMANISPKFGVVRLSVRCGGQVDVKVTQNRNWTKWKNPAKRGLEKKKCHDGPWVESTLDPSKKALRAAL